MTLPLFINKHNRIMMLFVCGLISIAAYIIPNHFHVFQPRLLPLTALDRAIPLVPWTVYVYLSEYVFFVIAYFMFDNEENRNRYVWTYMGVATIGALCFIFFPTTYPRADYPIPLDTHPMYFNAFEMLRLMDDASNCFPSLHVTCCYITAFSFLPKNESRFKFWFTFIWATAISASTLPTKQHYIVDIFAGLALSIFGYWWFFKKVKYIQMDEFTNKLRYWSDFEY